MKKGTDGIPELLLKYQMKPHEENGSFSECNYMFEGDGRAPSGSAYFFVPPGEKTLFHRIDCDEYWCFHAGTELDIWKVDTEGKLTREKFGLGPDAEPLIFFPKGVAFGSRNMDADGEGTFFSCVTVPRFSYSGFRILEQEEIVQICPETESFFKE